MIAEEKVNGIVSLPEKLKAEKSKDGKPKAKNSLDGKTLRFRQVQPGEDIIKIFDDNKKGSYSSLRMYSNEYMPGEVVTGELFLNLESSRTISRINMMFQAVEKSFDGVLPFLSRMTFQSKEFSSFKITIWKPDSPQKLKGQYCFHWEFHLPDDLQPSLFYKDLCFVYYQLRAYVVLAKDEGKIDNQLISEPLLVDVYGTSLRHWEKISKSSKRISNSQSNLFFFFFPI